MDLSSILSTITNSLRIRGWNPDLEDDYPDLKHIICRKLPGPFDAFTRLDVLIMTPELNPTDSRGACLCFLFYADPDKIKDMRLFGRFHRQNNFWGLQSECDPVLYDLSLTDESPKIMSKTRPKNERIQFENGEKVKHPAFFVEFDYWIPVDDAHQRTVVLTDVGG